MPTIQPVDDNASDSASVNEDESVTDDESASDRLVDTLEWLAEYVGFADEHYVSDTNPDTTTSDRSPPDKQLGLFDTSGGDEDA